MKTRNATTDPSDTKRKLLDASISLMRTKGFNATTVDNICGEAGVTKGGFFHYFTSKEDLAKATIAHFRQIKSQELREASFRQLEDPLDRVFGRLDFARDSLNDMGRLTRGCLIGIFAQEVSLTHPELRDICRETFLAMAQDFEKDVAAAKALHAPASAFDPKSVAMLYVSIFQGSAIMAKAADSNAVLLSNIEQFRHYVEFLFGSAARASSKRGSATAHN